MVSSLTLVSFCETKSGFTDFVIVLVVFTFFMIFLVVKIGVFEVFFAKNEVSQKLTNVKLETTFGFKKTDYKLF